MLPSKDAQSEHPKRYGDRSGTLAELRSLQERPSQLRDGHRQRLRDLAQRVARVQALGGEYRRVGLSESAIKAASENQAVA